MTTTGRDRVICVSLSEAEWKAFIDRHPEPVDWIRDQILGQIEHASELPTAQPGVRGEGPTGPWSRRRV
jgi:hypothetical protein